MNRPIRSAALLAATGALAVAAPASAQSPVPGAQPGTPAVFNYHVETFTAPVNGRIPQLLQFTIPSQSNIDFKALPNFCVLQNNTRADCDGRSRIGKGVMTFDQANTALGTNSETRANVNLFRSQNKGIVAYAQMESAPPLTPNDAGGEAKPFIFRGAYNTADGMLVTLLIPPNIVPSRGGPVRLKALDLQIGATTNQRVRVGKKQRSKAKRRYRTVKRHLVTLPRTCPSTGAWAAPVTMKFAEGDTVVAPNFVGCAPS